MPDFELFDDESENDTTNNTGSETITDNQAEPLLSESDEDTPTEDPNGSQGLATEDALVEAESQVEATENTVFAVPTTAQTALVVPPSARIPLHELARLIGVETRTAERWLQEGLLPEPCQKIRDSISSWRWDRNALEDWITSTADRLSKAQTSKVSQL